MVSRPPRPKTPTPDDVTNTEDDEATETSDKWNCVLLSLLYVLQGIFQASIHTFPSILQENGISYGQQSALGLSSMPLTVAKLVLAPLTECIYSAKLGKRKSWLIPSQYVLGLIMLYSSFHIDTWLGKKDEKLPDLVPIGILMWCVTLLLAASDMVLDGWAISMLQRKNVSYQAACNVIGYKVGGIVGHDLIILLRSAEITRFFGREKALLSFNEYFFFWSIMLLVVNTGVLIFKRDNSLENIDKNKQLSVVESYKLIWEILSLKSVRRLAFILLLVKAGMGPVHSLTDLKLIRGGMTAAQLVLLALPLFPVQAILPFVFRQYFRSTEGFIRYAKALTCQIPVGLMYCILLFYMPQMKKDGHLTSTFYTTYFVIHGFQYMVGFLMQISFMSFMGRIANPKYGAVYLTVMHSFTILGFIWPHRLSQALVDPLTFKKADCDIKVLGNDCIIVDGYYILVLLGSLFTICFLAFGGLNIMFDVQKTDEKDWDVPSNMVGMERDTPSTEKKDSNVRNRINAGRP